MEEETISELTTIPISKETRKRLKKFWFSRDIERTIKNYNELINQMIDFMEEKTEEIT